MMPQQSNSEPVTELQRKLAELPLLPTVVSELLAIDPTRDDYIDRLVQLVERDPAFSRQTIRCANSAFNPAATHISSLHEAVLRLGPQQTSGLVFGLAVARVFTPHSETQRFLLIHSLQTALFARMFCEQIPALKAIAAQAYVCGLLHDIGRFVQFEGAPAHMCKVDDRQWASSRQLVEMEREAVGYDHAALGWHACRKWGLPAAIGEAVRRHHDRLPACPSESPDLVQMIQWADVLSAALFMKPDLPFASPEELTRRLAAEYPSIVVGMPPVSETSWHRRVSGVYVTSMQLAYELIRFPASKEPGPRVVRRLAEVRSHSALPSSPLPLR
jgi:putative nucleotidyltransferase with HDIG domain